MMIRCYLDIETTGISWNHYEITVIGLAFETDTDIQVVQLFGDQITEPSLLESLEGVDTIYTYNGNCFDLPFIKKALNVDLKKQFTHRDLMYDCRKQNLKGGLKKVEEMLGINRQTKGIDGWKAVRLWWDYVNNNDQQALKTLLKYNAEDVLNLKILREKLNVQ